MSWSLRRASGVVLGVAVLAAIAFLQTAWSQPLPGVAIAQPAQPQPPGMQPGDLPDPSENLTFKKDNDKAAKIQAAEDYINTEDWKQATELLQQLLQLEADVFAQLPRKGPDGKVTKVWTSVRGEAKRLVSTLPRVGMEFYKVTYGPSATEQLQKAKDTGDPTFLADVMRRFLYTDAGGEATSLLATYYLDRGDYTAAALCFKRLIERDGLGKVEKNILFKAAYAFHQIADQKAEDDVWKELGSRGGAVRLGDRNHNVEDLQKFVGGLVRMVSEFNRTTWPIFGGNSNRNGKAEGDTAFMEARWRLPLTNFEASRERIKQATDYLIDKQQPLLSSFHPVTASLVRDGQKVPVVLFRGYDGIHAYHLKTGQRLWMAPSGLSLDGLFRSAFKVGYITSALDQYVGGQKLRPTILFDNSTTGTVSSDNNMVFVIEDVAVPPPPTYQGTRPPVGGTTGGMEDVNNGNKLQAWSLATGKLRWIQGSKDDHSSAELRDTYFLGPPLPVAGRLYVLVEKQQDLKLAELDAVTGKLLRLQPLAEMKTKLQQDINRRLNAAHLAAGEGMLICPTNAGAVLCIDMLENSLVWAYSYGETRPMEPGVGPGRPIRPGFPPGIGPDGRPIVRPVDNNSWRNTAPIIQGGKVYFAAPDAQSLHCVNLVDGSRIWTHRRTDDDLYLAGVFNGKVLIVGRRSVRALDALKGDQLWSIPTGQPSGMGVCSDNLYYLPLREGVEGKDPEILAIDLERGAVHAHTKSRKKEIPGNLVFFDGDVISQSTGEIAVFPQLRVKLAQIDERIKTDPNDPIGLVERGELRLDKGDLQGAVEDLNRALQQPTIPKELVGKAREKLFETLTDYLQRDFNGAEKYLETYESLCKVEIPADATAEVKAEKEAEARRRRTVFLCLVAKGREAQRRLVEAFEKYQEFAVFAGSEERITAVDEPAVQAAPDVWVQGRIMALMQGASEQERKPLEQRVQKQWEGLRETADAATVRRFVAVFGSHFPAGKEARLALAEKLIDSPEVDSLLEAERHLLLLMQPRETPDVAARAVDCMARLLTKRGLLDDAAYYYDRLGREYAEVVVADGRKGADIFNDLATDKRFLPQLDRVVKVGMAPRWKVSEDRSHNPMQGTNYQFDRVGEPLPFFDRWQFSLRIDQNELRLEDKLATDEKREVRKLGTIQMQYLQNIIYQQAQVNQNRRYDQPRLAAQCVGHLAIFQIGYMVYAVDPVSPRPQRVLWEKNLITGVGVAGGSGPRPAPPPGGISFGTDPDGTPTVIFQEGFVQRLGTPASLDSGVLCLQTRDTLLAVDPLTGRVLWTRGDVRSSARVTCEEGHVFVVEMSPTGQPANTRVFRLADGVTVPRVPDFAAVYQKKNRTLGRLVLHLDANPAGGQVARLYDPLQGKDIWEQSYPANSLVLQSVNPHLFGTIAPDGTLTVTDLRQRKVVLTNKVRMQDFNALISTHLLTDGRDYFVVCNGPVEQRIAAFGGAVQPPIMINQGMRSLPANGMVYSFNGETGKLRWISRAENQQLILDRFEEMPVMLFASRYQGFGRGQPQQVMQITALETVNKSNGKLLYRNSTDPGETRSDGLQPLPQGGTFFALHLNPAEGKFEFIANNFKLTHRADLEAK